jgi:hypothetical protein
MEKNDAMTN